jgi:hypothetical protein
MSTKDLILNISVNMGRMCRLAIEGKPKRVNTFIEDTEVYLKDLMSRDLDPKIEGTVNKFWGVFLVLKTAQHYDEVWAEHAMTWANILQHRSNNL